MDIMQQIKEEWEDKPDIWVVNITIGELKELIKQAKQEEREFILRKIKCQTQKTY